LEKVGVQPEQPLPPLPSEGKKRRAKR